MKIMTMKEWALYQTAQKKQCSCEDKLCSPHYTREECIDCYGEYVESMLPKCNKKVVIKNDKDN